MARDRQTPKTGRQEFLRRHKATLSVGAALLVVAGVGIVLFAGSDGAPAPKKVAPMVMVAIQPPPPPPPPPPPMDQPKMVEQQKMDVPEFKPEQPRLKDEPPAKAPDLSGPLGLDAKAEGPGDSFGLAGTPGGGGLLGGGGGGSRWGWYATIVQNQIEAALRGNPKTKKAAARNEIRLWLDGVGRVERARLVSSTGDADVDRAIETEVLPGLQFREAPPKDMPMPVVVRLTARRPG